MKLSLQQKPLGKIMFKKKKQKQYFKTKIQPKFSLRGQPLGRTPAISEDDLKQGMLNLINRGIIPKDVDLTPAFERGKPLLLAKKSLLQPSFMKHKIRTDVYTGPVLPTNIKFDVITAVKKYGKLKPLVYPKGKSQELEQQQQEYQKQRLEALQQLQPLPEPIEAKEYEEVMDEFSLHYFMVRKGKTIRESPEFQSYQRTFLKDWIQIERILTQIEQICMNYKIAMVKIDGKKLVDLSRKKTEITFKDLVDCLADEKIRQHVVENSTLKYLGPKGRIRAIIKIQSFFRMFIAKRTYLRVQALIEKVKIIQKAWRLKLKYKNTQKQILEKWHQCHDDFLQRQQNFMEDWTNIKYQQRVEIHYNSITMDELQRLSMEKFMERQNQQIARIFRLKDPEIQIIYICPFQINMDIIKYYQKIFEIGNLINYKNRLHIVHPENYRKFHGHYPLSKMILYSPDIIKRVKRLIGTKAAYLVPGFPSNDDIKISQLLKLPIMSGDPQKNFFHSTKSGAKNIFSECDIPIPPGSFDIYDQKEFLLTLTKLIAYNLDVTQWIFKIDDEFGSRGLAFLNINSIKQFVELRKKDIQITEEVILKIHEILSSVIAIKTQICNKTLYHSFQEFMRAFTMKGGVIEAVPTSNTQEMTSISISFQVEPDGNVNLVGSYDKFFGIKFLSSGYFFPQRSMPNMNLNSLIQTLGSKLYEKGVFGYCSVDLVSFPDPEHDQQLFWALGLKCYMDNATATTLYFDFMMKGNINQISGEYNLNKYLDDEQIMQHLDQEVEQRCFMYIPILFHSGLKKIQFKTFFHMCRLEGISYDIENKTGTTFLLLNNLQSGTLGILTIGDNRKQSVKYMKKALDFIVKQAGQLLKEYKNQFMESRGDLLPFSDVVSAVRLCQRQFERKQRKLKLLNTVPKLSTQ